MFTQYRTLGLILKKENRGEADQLFTVYTKNFGKLEVVGKAIRKISSKLRPAADLFYLSEIEFVQGKNKKILTDAAAIEKFNDLRRDSEKRALASRISEIVCALIRGQESDEKIWQLLLEAFDKLNNIDRSDNLNPETYTLVYHYFAWNLFSFLGYRPRLEKCVFCAKKLEPENLYFIASEGGVACGGCAGTSQAKIPILPDVVKVIRIILDGKWQVLSRLKLAKRHSDNLQQVFRSYFEKVSL